MIDDISEMHRACVLAIFVRRNVTIGDIWLLNSSLHKVLILLWVLHCVQIDNHTIWFRVTNLNTNSTSKCWVRFTKEMLYSFLVENTKRQAWFIVILLRIFQKMCLLLNSFKFRKKVFASILNCRFSFLNFTLLLFLLHQMSEDGVINWKSFKRIKLFDKFETHWASDSPFPKNHKLSTGRTLPNRECRRNAHNESKFSEFSQKCHSYFCKARKCLCWVVP